MFSGADMTATTLAPVIFIDPLAPKPYGVSEDRLRGLGGTEATVVRIARGLSQHTGVEIRQAARQDRRQEENIALGLPDECFPPGAVLVVINSWKLGARLRRRHPDQRWSGSLFSPVATTAR